MIEYIDVCAVLRLSSIVHTDDMRNLITDLTGGRNP